MPGLSCGAHLAILVAGAQPQVVEQTSRVSVVLVVMAEGRASSEVFFVIDGCLSPSERSAVALLSLVATGQHKVVPRSFPSVVYRKSTGAVQLSKFQCLAMAVANLGSGQLLWFADL